MDTTPTVNNKILIRKNMGNITENIKAEILGVDNRKQKRFYVHYINFNRRLDEWVTDDLFVEGTLEVSKKRRKTITKDKTSDNKKNDQLFADDNKMKVIDRVHINGKTMCTWYFSPYPQYMRGTVYLCAFCFFYFDDKDSQMYTQTSTR